MNNDSLAQTKWNCKYHIVFAPKYRRQAIYGKIKKDIGTILRKLYEFKGIEIIEANACKDHIRGGKYSTENSGIKFYRIFKRKKFIDDI